MRGFAACMQCGSLELRSPKASEGGIGVAFFDLSRCRECGWQGMPLEFESEQEWRAFIRAKRGEAGEIVACRQCGSSDLRIEGTAAACPHCGWRGEPMRFSDYATWLAFAETRKNEKGRSGEAG